VPPFGVLRVADPQDWTRDMPAGRRGRVVATALLEDLFIPNLIERDSSRSTAPHPWSPWDGGRAGPADRRGGRRRDRRGSVLIRPAALLPRRPPKDEIPLPSSNGLPVEFDDCYFAPMGESTGLLAAPESLRERFREEGYVLLRGVLDPKHVQEVRAEYFATFPAGYFKPGTQPADGVYSGHTPEGLPPYGIAGHPAHAFVRSGVFAELTAQPALQEIAQMLLDSPAYLVPRQVLRHFDLTAKRATRAHVDRAYPSGAEPDLVTVWIPVGDCPFDRGGLLYLSGSHRLEPEALRRAATVTDRPDDPRSLSHDLAWTARMLGGRWLWADFRMGDVAVHGPNLVHASLDNKSEVMRLSADIRFQHASAPLDLRWSVPWAADDGA
jgi:hypothetical protein